MWKLHYQCGSLSGSIDWISWLDGWVLITVKAWYFGGISSLQYSALLSSPDFFCLLPLTKTIRKTKGEFTVWQQNKTNTEEEEGIRSRSLIHIPRQLLAQKCYIHSLKLKFTDSIGSYICFPTSFFLIPPFVLFSAILSLFFVFAGFSFISKDSALEKHKSVNGIWAGTT